MQPYGMVFYKQKGESNMYLAALVRNLESLRLNYQTKGKEGRVIYPAIPLAASNLDGDGWRYVVEGTYQL